MTVTTPSARRDPLRTYQFRVGLLPPPAAGLPGAPATTVVTFLGESTGRPPAPESTPAGAPNGYVAGVKRVSGLNLTVSPHEVWEGGNALHRYANPDRATWDPITLEQGLAIDDTLERWANAVVRFLREGRVKRQEPVKRNVIIDVWDPGMSSPGTADGGGAAAGGDGPGLRVRRYLVFNAWISRFQAIPQLDALTNEVALLTVELTHEGWRADTPSSFGPPRPVRPTPGNRT